MGPVQVQVGKQQWKLIEPFSYRWRLGNKFGTQPYRITIPKGFQHDGASVPRIAWPFISPFSLRAGAVLHDFIYRYQGNLPSGSYQYGQVDTNRTRFWRTLDKTWTRKQADRLMCRVAREFGVSKWKRRTAFWAVRLFGQKAWDH